MTNEDKILSTVKICKSFGGLKAVDKVSIDIDSGKIIGLIGPNGSGKSTFFNLVTRILDQNDEELGNISYGKKNVNQMKTHELAKAGLIRTYQNTKLFDKLTVLENIMVAAPKHPGESLITVLKDMLRRKRDSPTWRGQEKEFAEKAIEILKFFEIYHLVNEKASVLSGGQRKLLSLALVLMAAPNLILLDEPVAGVNPTLSNKIFANINSIREKGTTFFIVEHNMDVIMESSDLIYVMDKGAIIARDVPEVIQKDPEVLSAYLGVDD